MGSRGKGKKASSGLGESQPGNFVREKDHGLLWGVKSVLNVQICIKCVKLIQVLFSLSSAPQSSENMSGSNYDPFP